MESQNTSNATVEEPNGIKTVAHVPFGYFPDTLGGTEVYVAGLIDELAGMGVASAVIASGQRADYLRAGARVVRVPASPDLSLEALYGDGDVGAAREFGAALDAIKPHMAHFHAFTPGASLLAMRECDQRKIPVVMTYHTPTVTCVRGTMLYWGGAPCDGVMEATRCAGCNLHGRGMPKWLAIVAAHLPLTISRWAAQRLPSKAATVLGARWLTTIRHQAVRSAFALCERVVSPCHWVSDVLARNGVPMSKIFLSRQGLSRTQAHAGDVNEASPAVEERTRSAGRKLRLVFLGRIDPTKGLHTLLDALSSIPSSPVSLAIFGTQKPGDAYFERIRELVSRDHRVTLNGTLDNAAVVATMREYDIVVVPSEWLETGPLVIYEAFAAGLPVLGSNLGGIAELVSDGRNGRLLPPGDVNAWAGAITNIADNLELIDHWKRNLPPPRTMLAVAEDMRKLYETPSSGQSKTLGS